MRKDNSIMGNIKIVLVWLWGVFTPLALWAQQEQSQQRSTCARTLQLAQSVYQRGDVHRVPALLEGCLNKKDKNTGFTKQERVEALKILALSHMYREEPEKADIAMLNLLKTDHFFKINEAIDPKEFITMYETFRTYSLFSIGAKIGPTFAFPHANQLFYASITDDTKGSGNYSPILGFQAGLTFEVPLFRKPAKRPIWVAAPELRYASSAFSYNAYLTKDEYTNKDNSTIEAIFAQHRIQLDMIMQYRLVKSSLNPYIGFGPSIGYLLSSDAQLETQFTSTNNVVNGPAIDFTSNFNAVNLDLVASIGGAKQLGGVLVVFDIRYQYGLVQILNKASRINTEAALDYGYILNSFTQNSVMLNLGFSIPIFVPKKLPQKKLTLIK